MTLNMLPLFNSLTVGFDSMFDELSKLPTSTFPPYNIQKVEDGKYKITFAVAGFTKQDIDVSCKENTLKVSGKVEMPKNADYLYKGIAERAFNQSFKLADYTTVVGAEMKDGLLHVELEQELPESKKEKKVNIK
ncbi:MAG: Hsp20 family protein [Minisyncoccia bacterium]|jgi:molecular chaperone IbpA